MADFVFNIAKGRVTELANRVNLNDPANSAFLIAILSAGAATDASRRTRRRLRRPTPATHARS
jgi:hypothetical protein